MRLYVPNITSDVRVSGLAPEVGFEPTTNRLTADRSTTELLWISQLKKREWVFSRTIGFRQLPMRKMACGQTHLASLLRYFRYHESVIFNISRARSLYWQRSHRSSWACPHGEERGERHGDYRQERCAQYRERHKESGPHRGPRGNSIVESPRWN